MPGRVDLHHTRGAEGESLFDVPRRLGHGSIATTADLYGHVVPGGGKKQAYAFAQAMGIKQTHDE